jgi:hypothetical protein
MTNDANDTNDRYPRANVRQRLTFFICHFSFVICLVILGFLLRICPIGRYVTPDEPAWVYRAIRFVDAVAARDWTAVPSTGHPGVTTMWLGAAGVAVQRWLAPSASAAHLGWIRRLAWLAPENGEAFRHLAFFLPGGRVAVALVTALGLAVLYPLLVRLFDRRVALLGVGLLAFDPFLVGHSGLLHTDALLAVFSPLALTAALCGLREPRRAAWPVLSGFFTGLALLTKTPALILPPFILLLMAVGRLWKAQTWKAQVWKAQVWKAQSPNPKSQARRWSLVVVHWALFIFSAIVTCLALYPALWGDPIGTLRTLSAFAGRHIEMVQRPIFFAGRMTYNPGVAFYPTVFVFRISPVVLAGLVIGLVTLRRLSSKRRFAFLLMVAFAIGFGALMGLGAKKHDRYLLPAFPPLTLAAALALSRPQTQGPESEAQPAHLKPEPRDLRLFLPLGLQLALMLPFVPYPLTCFNPLAGGPWVAARVLPVDWGEGMGAAARWLNGLPHADRLTVAASSVPSFAPIFEGRTLPLDQATLADYVVRPPAHSPTSARPYPVAHRTHLGFLDHAAIYTNTAPLEQGAYLAARAGPDDLVLLDADTPLLRHYAGPATLAFIGDRPDQAAVATRLRELSAGRSSIWLVADPAAPPITAAHLRRGLEAIATSTHTATVASATIWQFSTPSAQGPTPNAQLSTFGDALTLIDALLPVGPVSVSCPVFLRWQVPAPMPADLHASLYLRDPAGHLWAEVGQPVLNDVYFPTSVWSPGEWADGTLTLKPPERIPPGAYAVQLTVTDAEGAQLGAWDADGRFQGVRVSLGDVEIAPPTEPVGPAPCAEGHALAAEPFLACVPDLPPPVVASGDMLTLALTWSSVAVPGADYRVRWRLLDPVGSVALEQTADLCPYATSRWRAGDSFEARYDLWFDPALPAGRYRLALNVLAPDGRPRWPEDQILTAVEIDARDRLFELPAGIAYPLDLTLGAAVHLRGFDIAPSPVEEGVGEGGLRPGDTLSLTLYWQADGPTDLNYTVFVHLVGPDGRPHGQADWFPGGGAAPTTSWAPGQVTVDEVTLSVAAGAPAGAYHVAVGMYDAASGGRLPVTDASGQPVPDDQVVLPVEFTVAGDTQ